MNPLPFDLTETVQRALSEDVGQGDITARLISEETSAHAQVISREAAILCGTAWFEETFRQLDDRIQVTWHVQDGNALVPQQVVCHLAGPARGLLTGERTALNFLQLLSGTATQTQHYVKAMGNTQTKLLDTRKTLPGLRRAQKYAVQCGGGKNHRMGLYDAFLIKENHILAAGSITQAVMEARRLAPHFPVEVEVETFEQIQEALRIKVEILLLDNFSLEMLHEAVALAHGRAKLEASGGITLENIEAIAKTGVDYISVGAMTKHIHAVDFSMRIMIGQ